METLLGLAMTIGIGWIGIKIALALPHGVFILIGFILIVRAYLK